MPKLEISWKYTVQQKQFIETDADEVMYGGAAGGGKSYAQIMDATIKAIQYPGIKQLIMRTSFPELERSIIRTAFQIIPRQLYTYHTQKHVLTFINGSIIDFGYASGEGDVSQYQSAEYDIIRFDEATNFPPYVLNYLASRLRGANKFPKQIKYSTNPGGVSHTYLKERFINPSPPNKVFKVVDEDGDVSTRLFIPAKVTDNVFLMKADPKYVKRLKGLSEGERKKLLEGSWEIYDGLFFPEFSRDRHVISPRRIEGTRYCSVDYGLDMFAALFFAVDKDGNAVCYKEIYEPNLIISEAVERLRSVTEGEDIERYLAPRDLWNRRQETGKNVADYFLEAGIRLHIAPNKRVPGLLNVKEFLHDSKTIFGDTRPKLLIFDNCVNLIRCLSEIQTSTSDPEDVAKKPHELTHAVDALRYFCASQIVGETAPDESEGDYGTDEERTFNERLFDIYNVGDASYGNGYDYGHSFIY